MATPSRPPKPFKPVASNPGGYPTVKSENKRAASISAQGKSKTVGGAYMKKTMKKTMKKSRKSRRN
jgi:hypothetical protein